MGSRIVSRVRDLRDDAAEWCEGRSALPRAALLAYLGYAGVRHLLDPLYSSWFGGITLVFHEMGHIVFSVFGRTMTILGGSLMQLLVPLAAGAYLLLRQRDWFGVAVCMSWLAFSEWGLATYVADASREQLPLVGFSDRPEHDWSTLLTQWHLLNSDQTIAACIRGIALGTWALAMALGVWLSWRMVKSARGS